MRIINLTTRKAIAILLLLVAIVSVMTSCSKESRNERRIVGKWSLIRETTSYYDAFNMIVEAIESSDVGWVYEFTGNGDVILAGLVSTPFFIDGETLKIKKVGSEDCRTYKIEELTSTSMLLSERLSWMGGETYAIRRSEFKKLTN